MPIYTGIGSLPRYFSLGSKAIAMKESKSGICKTKTVIANYLILLGVPCLSKKSAMVIYTLIIENMMEITITLTSLVVKVSGQKQ